VRSDTAHGVALVVASKEAWLFHLELPALAVESDWWDLEFVLENFRTPVTSCASQPVCVTECVLRGWVGE
jgi:hypothetical protein